MAQFPNNSPVADFLCGSCSEEFELKSQKGKFGTKVADGAYKTKCERLIASNNPNLLLMNYDLKSLAVVNLFIVPKHFFVRDIIEERKPLAATARRAGWIGSNILIGNVPEAGKIYIVQNGVIRPKETVLQEWQKTLFLRNEFLEARGWLLDVMKCVDLWAGVNSRSIKFMDSSGTSANFTRATRMCGQRFASSSNTCVTRDFWNSCRVVIIACDPRRLAWPGFSTSTNARVVGVDGPTSGRVCATTIARIAEPAI